MNKKTVKKKMSKATNFQEHLNELLKDKEFKQLFDDFGKQLEISYQILQLRKKKKMSQAQLAKKIRTTQSNVARIESGNQNLTIEMLNRVATALGTNLTIKLGKC